MFVSSINSSTSRFLDALRWMSALAVVLTHIDDKVLKPVSETAEENRSFILFFWKLISDSGTEAVYIFFLISGYLVGGAALSEFSKYKNLDLKKYFIKRCSRLYIVLIPALLICTLLDSYGLLFGSEIAERVYGSRVDQLTSEVFLANLLFLQGTITSTFGTNDPLWSLAYEAFYYLIFALFLVTVSSKRSVRIRLFFGSIVLLLCYLVDVKMLTLGVIWVFGALLRTFSFRVKVPWFFLLTQFVGLLILIRLEVDWFWKNTITGSFIVALAIAISLSLPLLRLQNDIGAQKALQEETMHHNLANFSFTLYAIHMPVLTLLIALSENYFNYGLSIEYTSFLDVFYGVFLAVTCVFIAKLIYFFTEAKTQNIQRYLLNISSK